MVWMISTGFVVFDCAKHLDLLNLYIFAYRTDFDDSSALNAQNQRAAALNLPNASFEVPGGVELGRKCVDHQPRQRCFLADEQEEINTTETLSTWQTNPSKSHRTRSHLSPSHIRDQVHDSTTSRVDGEAHPSARSLEAAACTRYNMSLFATSPPCVKHGLGRTSSLPKDV